jgi:hypothetical protein
MTVRKGKCTVGLLLWPSRGGDLVVTGIKDDTHAADAGLAVCDIIAKLNGESIGGKKPEEVVKLMEGEHGTYVTLTTAKGLETRVKRDLPVEEAEAAARACAAAAASASPTPRGFAVPSPDIPKPPDSGPLSRAPEPPASTASASTTVVQRTPSSECGTAASDCGVAPYKASNTPRGTHQPHHSSSDRSGRKLTEEECKVLLPLLVRPAKYSVFKVVVVSWIFGAMVIMQMSEVSSRRRKLSICVWYSD